MYGACNVVPNGNHVMTDYKSWKYAPKTMARGLSNQDDYIIQQNKTYKKRIQSAPKIEVCVFVPISTFHAAVLFYVTKCDLEGCFTGIIFCKYMHAMSHKHQYHWRWERGRLWTSKKLMLRMLFSNICKPTIHRRCGPNLANVGKQSPLITRKRLDQSRSLSHTSKIKACLLSVCAAGSPKIKMHEAFLCSPLVKPTKQPTCLLSNKV